MSSTLADPGTVEKYKQAFQEEAREILVELESTLLQLNENRGDSELVGQTFRALHTIKGSGAMFGFSDVAAFTHNIENAYDEVRNGRMHVTAELVDLSLAALDHIKAMLNEAMGHGFASAPLGVSILEKLQDLTGTREHPLIEAVSSQSTDAPATQDLPLCKSTIRFSPGPDLMCNGTDPLLLLRELRELGSLTVVADTANVPRIADLDPQRCYVSWDMTLVTTAPLEAIQDVFVFAEDCCDLVIRPLAVETATAILVAETSGPQPRTYGRRADDGAGSASNIRVPTLKLDQFVDLVGELVTVQARLAEIASRLDNPDVEALSEEVERLTSALRENSMSIRMLPIRATFERFRRLIHDLARDLGKQVELTIEGADTELDKTVIDQLNDPLMHLIRNSMDHGIESSADRAATGKNPVAKIHLSARHSGASVLIGVTDDGAGIDANAVRARGVQKGLITAEAQLTESQIFALIFEAGFSTAQKVTDISGRGVGMDVVRRRVESLRGSIDIASTRGSGTAVTLLLPLTLAIIDGLLVKVGDAHFVLPLANILECIELSRHDRENANGKHVVNVRGEIIPYIRLKEFFHIRTPLLEREQIMVAATENGRYGFVVDEVLGDHQTVIKNLGKLYRHVQVISGATILGNGAVALILDPNKLAQEAIKTMSIGRDSTKFDSTQ